MTTETVSPHGRRFPYPVVPRDGEPMKLLLDDGSELPMGRLLMARRCTDTQVILESLVLGREFAVSFEVFREKLKPRNG